MNASDAGLLTLALAGSVLLVSSRRRQRRTVGTARERPWRGEAPDVRG
jgi:hypothetical protein